MTNLEMIELAKKQFKDGDLQACEKILVRIKNNFNLQDDEYSFKIVAEIYQPYLEIGKKLLADDRADLIGNPFQFDYRAKELKIKVLVSGLEPYAIIEGDEDIDLDDIKIFYHASVRFDNEGITAATGNGTPKIRKQAMKIVKKWLKKEFGKLKHWD